MLSCNNSHLPQMCIESIRKYTDNTETPFEIILVNNGSDDKNSEKLEKMGGYHFYVKSKHNKGFPGGMNMGIRQAMLDECKYIVLASDDTQYTHKDWLRNMIEASQEYDAGIVGPLSNYVCEREQQMNTYGGELPNQHIHLADKHDAFIAFVNPLITRSTIKRIGYLDEIFGLGNYEDNDYCMRAKQASISMIIDGFTYVYHKPGSIGHVTNNPGWRQKFERNKTIFIRKWKEEGII